MADNIGTPLISPIVPKSTGDTFPTHYDYYGFGGYRVVDTLIERDSITLDRQKEGMAVFVVETNTLYQLLQVTGTLSNSNWQSFLNGPQGVTGTTGPQGSTGLSITGPQGSTGTIGVTGPQGTTGPSITGNQGSVGVQGPKGVTGAQGSQGSQGYQGYDGIQGSRGYQGEVGSTGVTGSQGPQGRQGSTGNQGSMGYQGPQGTTGLSGNQGHQGTQGVQGAPSTVQGPQGDTGNQGSTGPQGRTVTGSQGSQGFQGAQGSTGVQGSQGIVGQRGFQGDQGIQGPTGVQGSQGYQGTTGADSTIQGPQGTTGPQGLSITGPQGSTGADSTVQGPQGVTGPQGRQGGQGVTGSQGNRGFQGDTITGPQGFQGYQGQIGAQGYQGRQGSTGVQGSQGHQGVTGADSTVQGATGVTGPQGSTGAQGPQGLKGNVGSQGSQGIQGTQGVTGNQGPQGSTGADSTVQGPTGITGPQGRTVTGAQGSQGFQGVQGSQGSQGVTGSQGFQGNTGLRGFQGATGVGGVTGNSIIDILYNDLIDLVDGTNINGNNQNYNRLSIGNQYRITDFYTSYIQPETNKSKRCQYDAGDEPNISDLYEPIIVTATSISTISTECKSQIYPQDIIHYVLENSAGSEHGRIVYRKDIIKNIEAYEDWRNIWYARWSPEFAGDYSTIIIDNQPWVGYTITGKLPISLLHVRIDITDDINYLYNLTLNNVVVKTNEPIIWDTYIPLEGYECGYTFNFANKNDVLLGLDAACFFDPKYIYAYDKNVTSCYIEVPMIPVDIQGRNISFGQGHLYGNLTNTVVGINSEYYGTINCSEIYFGNRNSNCTVNANSSVMIMTNSNNNIYILNSDHSYIGTCVDGTYLEHCVNVTTGENGSNNVLINCSNITIGCNSYGWYIVDKSNITIEDGLDGTNIITSSDQTYRRSPKFLLYETLTDLYLDRNHEIVIISSASTENYVVLPEPSQYIGKVYEIIFAPNCTNWNLQLPINVSLVAVGVGTYGPVIPMTPPNSSISCGTIKIISDGTNWIILSSSRQGYSYDLWFD